jgi:hypothetical protein
MDAQPLAAQQRVVRLLTTLVALAAVLVVSLGLGAALAWREYSRLRTASQAALGDRGAGAIIEEVSARQQRAVDRLDAMGRDAKRQIAVFEKRAAEIRAKDGGGPIDSAAKALDIASLMMDQSLLALKLTTAMQEAIVKGALPLDAGPAETDAVVQDEANAREEQIAPRSARRPPPAARGERETK